MQSPRPTGIKSSMLITLAWLLVACLVANRAEPSMAASLAAGPQQSQESAESAPATLIELAAAAAAAAARNQFAPIQQQQPQIVRRRRSSEQLWPANAAAAQRRFSRHQQKLAGDAAFSRQLSELIAQARNDKNLERSLLRMLINASLRPQAASNSMVDGAASEPASIDQLLAGAERAQREQQESGSGSGSQQALSLIEYLEQRLNQSPGFVDQSSVSGNDLGQLIAAEPTAAAAYAGVDKREFKPCSFNAISCAKNPFRSS